MQKKRKKQAKIGMSCYEERKKEDEDEKQELEFAEGFRRINKAIQLETEQAEMHRKLSKAELCHKMLSYHFYIQITFEIFKISP